MNERAVHDRRTREPKRQQSEEGRSKKPKRWPLLRAMRPGMSAGQAMPWVGDAWCGGRSDDDDEVRPLVFDAGSFREDDDTAVSGPSNIGKTGGSEPAPQVSGAAQRAISDAGDEGLWAPPNG